MMGPKLKLFVSLICAVVLGASQARAITYTYTGNDFTSITDQTPPTGIYTTSMSVTGSFTLAAPLAANLGTPATPTDIFPLVLSFSFSDGRNTLTNNSVLAFPVIEVATDSLGNIDHWIISLFTRDFNSLTQTGDQRLGIVTDNRIGSLDSGVVEECVSPDPSVCSIPTSSFNRDNGSVDGHPGSWSTATPLPAALPLFATGLGAIGLLGWRRKRKALRSIICQGPVLTHLLPVDRLARCRRFWHSKP
jgi:hypothetical protein